MKRAATSDVEQLQPAADGEDGEATGVGLTGQLKLKDIQIGLRRARCERAGAGRSFRDRGPGPPDRQTPETRDSRPSRASTANGGTTTGIPPADWIAYRYFRPSAISCWGGSPWGVTFTSPLARISDVLTAISGRGRRMTAPWPRGTRPGGGRHRRVLPGRMDEFYPRARRADLATMAKISSPRGQDWRATAGDGRAGARRRRPARRSPGRRRRRRPQLAPARPRDRDRRRIGP